MEWSIRSANPTDEADLHRLALESEPPGGGEGWSAASIAAALGGRGARVRLAEVAPGRTVGFVLARRIADLLEIDRVGVRVGDRRRGIARSLLESLIDEERSAGGLTEVRLELAASNAPARALYEGLGFMVVGRRTRYYPDGDDALLLARAIPPERSPSTR